MQTLLDEFNFMSDQIHNINDTQKLYPLDYKEIFIELTDPHHIRTYKETDIVLDRLIDNVILNMEKEDHYKIAAMLPSAEKKPQRDEDEDYKLDKDGNEVLFCININKECYEYCKNILEN